MNYPVLTHPKPFQRYKGWVTLQRATPFTSHLLQRSQGEVLGVTHPFYLLPRTHSASNPIGVTLREVSHYGVRGGVWVRSGVGHEGGEYGAS
jgi:hypothetical protein